MQRAGSMLAVSGELARRVTRFAIPGDGAILRGVFYLMLAGIAIGLIHDYDKLAAQMRSAPQTRPIAVPVLPAYAPAREGKPAETRAHPQVETSPDALRAALSITLVSGGVLELTGSIDPGSAGRFRDEVTKVGEYVNIVALSSPGGSVRDALAISRLIRERGFATAVRDGALCASSCPLVLAGGVERLAGKKAAIGVHQVFTAARGGRNPDLEVSDTQALTAEITRHLKEMGADEALWLHALDTPPDALYYFSADELEAYRLATRIEEAAKAGS